MTPVSTTAAELARYIRGAAKGRQRLIVGIAGPPGAAKSTLASQLVALLSGDAVLVPMDGFHLANSVLDNLGRRQHKGAPDTFDANGYIALLRRLRNQTENVVYAPTFRRDLEEPIAAGISVYRHTPIVITEGNYLLLETPPWSDVRALLDIAWFLDMDQNTRIHRLVARHHAFGKTVEAARLWAEGSDERNAELVRPSQHRADAVLRLEDSPESSGARGESFRSSSTQMLRPRAAGGGHLDATNGLHRITGARGMDSESELGDVVTGFVAQLTGRSHDELPSAAGSRGDWLALLRQWLARYACGLVSIANPQKFSWPGHWIGVVDSPHKAGDRVAVLLFGTPSAVIASPAAPALIGKSVDELRFRQGLLLVPFQPFAQPAVNPARTVGEVVGIYVSDVRTGPMKALAAATAVKGRGLLGDRYATKTGTFTPRSPRLRGYDVTLIESEVLDQLTLADGSQLAAGESRRNLVTRGVDLNALVGREFSIGPVRAFGQRFCEPCVHLERLTRPGVVAGLVHRGGLRADILTDGEIRLGDKIEAGSQTSD